MLSIDYSRCSIAQAWTPEQLYGDMREAAYRDTREASHTLYEASLVLDASFSSSLWVGGSGVSY